MPQTAILIPCYNEALTIAKVVKDFKAALPEAAIYVFDNNSTDQTSEIAKQAGATVVHSKRQGKGNVVRHMFESIDADYYIMADGDSTYPAENAPELLRIAQDKHIDMLVGSRLKAFEQQSFRKFHQFGNHIISRTIRALFNLNVSDVLSGYRVFSRHFVKTIPLRSEKFEIETELTLQAAVKKYTVLEVPINYGSRPEGSHSKLNTWSDGWLILKTITKIFLIYKPLWFFSIIAVLLALASVAAGTPPILDYVKSGYVYHIPLAILAASLGLFSGLCFAVGLILETIHRYHQENFILWKKILQNDVRK